MREERRDMRRDMREERGDMREERGNMREERGDMREERGDMREEKRERRGESVACTQASFSIGSERAPTAQAPALGSMIWLSAALLYSLVLSMLVSGGDPRRLQPLALSQDHSTTPQQRGQ